MAFYWVNIGTSYKEVKDFEFLWAPAYGVTAKGKKTVNAGWKFVPKVKKGDILFCYTNKEILYVAKANADAYSAPRPENRSFKEWAKDGYKIDVSLNVLDVPLNSDDFSQEFINLYNRRTEPKLFASNGRPAQQYMVSIPNSAGAFLLDQLDNLTLSTQQAFTDDEGVKSIENKTTQQAIIKARVGQGKFRKHVLDLWDSRCAVTGVEMPELLIASHIVSWQLSNDKQRLDPYNGLPLSPDIDKLFDQGLISFTNEGRIIKNFNLDIKVLLKLGLSENIKLTRIYKENIFYLEQHRIAHGF